MRQAQILLEKIVANLTGQHFAASIDLYDTLKMLLSNSFLDNVTSIVITVIASVGAVVLTAVCLWRSCRYYKRKRDFFEKLGQVCGDDENLIY